LGSLASCSDLTTTICTLRASGTVMRARLVEVDLELRLDRLVLARQRGAVQDDQAGLH